MIPIRGEIIYDKSNNTLKIGDGVTDKNDLPVISGNNSLDLPPNNNKCYVMYNGQWREIDSSMAITIKHQFGYDLPVIIASDWELAQYTGTFKINVKNKDGTYSNENQINCEHNTFFKSIVCNDIPNLTSSFFAVSPMGGEVNSNNESFNYLYLAHSPDGLNYNLNTVAIKYANMYTPNNIYSYPGKGIVFYPTRKIANNEYALYYIGFGKQNNAIYSWTNTSTPNLTIELTYYPTEDNIFIATGPYLYHTPSLVEYNEGYPIYVRDLNNVLDFYFNEEITLLNNSKVNIDFNIYKYYVNTLNNQNYIWGTPSTNSNNYPELYSNYATKIFKIPTLDVNDRISTKFNDTYKVTNMRNIHRFNDNELSYFYDTLSKYFYVTYDFEDFQKMGTITSTHPYTNMNGIGYFDEIKTFWAITDVNEVWFSTDLINWSTNTYPNDVLPTCEYLFDLCYSPSLKCVSFCADKQSGRLNMSSWVSTLKSNNIID